MSGEEQHPTIPAIKGTAISETYTVILRQGYLEFYHVDKGPWEKRDTPDFLLTPEETDGLHQFLNLCHPESAARIS